MMLLLVTNNQASHTEATVNNTTARDKEECSVDFSHQGVYKDLPQIIVKMAGLVVFC